MDLKESLIIGSICVGLLASLSLAENFEVSSSPSVIGTLGQDAVLPCQISLGIQPQNMEVIQWKNIGDNHVNDIYQLTAVTGQETFGSGYETRASLATKEGVATGNVALKLKNVQVRDEGIYKCIVKSSDWIAQTSTILHITALGNVSIEVLGPEGEGIKLACRSAGWFPKPELQWLAKNTQNPQLESMQDHEQLFSVWSNITVMKDTGEVTCSVYERHHLQMKQELTILLTGDIFPRTSPWLLAFWIFFSLTLLLDVGVVVYFRYRYKGKLKESNRKPDAEEEIMLQDFALTEQDLKRAQSCLVKVRLDPNHKHPKLEVSPDGRSVHCKSTVSQAAATSEAMIIVGTEGFRAGRKYWEVLIKKSDWEVGVLTEDARKKLKMKTLHSLKQEQYWSLKRLKGKYYASGTVPEIHCTNQPEEVGIDLNRQEGIISFYDVKRMKIIVRIPVETSVMLYPFFSPGLSVLSGPHA